MKLFEFLSVIPYILKTEMKIYKTYPVEEKKSTTTIIIELYKIKKRLDSWHSSCKMSVLREDISTMIQTILLEGVFLKKRQRKLPLRSDCHCVRKITDY